MTRHAILERMLAMTPFPPAELDAEELIATVAGMLGIREPLLAELEEADTRPTAEEQALAHEILARDLAWAAAITAARDAIGATRVGAGQLRRYAPAP